MLEISIRKGERESVVRKLKRFGDVYERNKVRHCVMLDAPITDAPQIRNITGVLDVEDGNEVSFGFTQTHVLTKKPLLNSTCDLLALQAFDFDPDRIKHDLLYADTTLTRGNLTDGSGIVLGIVDNLMSNSGHTEFSGRFSGTPVYDGYPGDAIHPHGNQVACVAAGASYGIAPGASLVNARGLNASNVGANSLLINAMDAVLTEHESGSDQHFCNCSFGSASSSYEATVTDLADSGVPVFAAAGNSGQSLDVVDVYPAKAANSFTIGGISLHKAIFKGGDNNTSNFGSYVDVWAGYGPWWAVDDTGTFGSAFGTSFATPCVMGIAALLHQGQPKMTTLSEITSFYADLETRTKVDIINLNGDPGGEFKRISYRDADDWSVSRA